MGIIETVKGTIKATTNVMTGKTATVALETKGKLAPGEIVEVIFTIEPIAGPFESKGAFIELAGEDDLHETMLERVRELALFKGDPSYVIQVLGRFQVVAGEIKKVVPARFLMPADLDKARKWFMRGRVQAFGVDLVTPFVPIA